MVFSKKSSQALSRTSLIILFITFFVALSLVEAKTSSKNSAATANISKKKLAVLDGFRSAKFGMSEKQVLRSIKKDFKLSPSKTKRTTNSLEKTFAIHIVVPKLLGTGGTARVSYIFGHKSQKLSHVNIAWGLGVAKKVDGQSVVDTANLLRSHFAKKKYEDMLLNGKLSEGVILVFRGTDNKGRMAILILKTPKPVKDESQEDATKRISLTLSYVLNPSEPDILTIKEGDF
jgi:hypothetical protein